MAKQDKVRIRILVDYGDGTTIYRCNNSYDVAAEQAAAFVAAGIADDHPDAVAAAAAHVTNEEAPDGSIK